MGDCYVYQVVQNVEVRSVPSTADVYRTSRIFRKGELVSIDLVQEVSQQSTDSSGPFLRLSDGSGWVFEKKKSQGIMMIPSVVEKGFWCFYVDNFPVGMALRNHPIDQSDCNDFLLKIPQVCLKPMQKVYCDRRVAGTNGINFYRVQQGPGQTHAWVFDRRGQNFMMIPESMVETGLFAFQSCGHLGIRSKPQVGEGSKTGNSVKTNEFIVCDCIRESPYPDGGNGPFLRLDDGSGWLFRKKHHDVLMKPVAMDVGMWRLRVENKNGIALRKQPRDSTTIKLGKVYEHNEIVRCDRKIGPSPTGTTFYRVYGTKGWLFDRRDDRTMMTLLSQAGPVLAVAVNEDSGWSVAFVRGVAMAGINGMEEIVFNPDSRVISFQHPNGTRINVYYTTRTVGTALQHPRQGKTQLFRRNCSTEELVEIMKNPRVHTGHGYQQKPTKRHRDTLSVEVVASAVLLPVATALVDDVEIGEDEDVAEEDLRNRLLVATEEVNNAKRKEKALWQCISVHQQERIRIEQKKIQLAEDNLYAPLRLKKEKERQAEERKKEEEKQAEELRKRTCQKCGKVFCNSVALFQHARDAHPERFCPVCGKLFYSDHALNQHRDAVDHW